MQPTEAPSLPGYARSRAVSGGCLAALQAPPVGRQPMGYPLVPEGLYMGCSPPQLAC
ncbi:hypothetical protein [Flavonifractor sp. An82]|uniref:hypothetical protein n=1 Tax=Flavonifractor sp. An82 TaxID=1965660 RepID=UPI0013A687E3|nr:hypothetical protein [Flavonifractor sp. An82]